MAAAKATGSLTRQGPVSRAATVANDAAAPAGAAPGRGETVARAPAAGWRDMAAARARESLRSAKD